ncbi:expressed unknown protein [Seminavis robusta]|uniref:Uncharacterized protein n=1 Tax=Seminavis robusta TaxID=568900 RepID=A0A9N8HAV5_9STRA|nr:expressed unknown protein [Seminavis robusta]|eukprot:Sro335_g120100.1 n/a (395) ;mRNA; f:41541-42725
MNKKNVELTAHDPKATPRRYPLIPSDLPVPIPIIEAKSTTTTELPVVVVDIISIGSAQNKALQQVQKETFGSHPMVRFFWDITEQDDPNPKCATSLTYNDTLAIRQLCRSPEFHLDQPRMLKKIRHHIFSKEYLDPKPKDSIPGWMCAQQRPMAGLLKAMKAYEQQEKPDFLIIMDDDTYYNMDLMLSLHNRHNFSKKTAMTSPCFYTSPVRYPQGGFGSVWTKGLLNAIQKPILCKTKKQHKNICDYIQQNNFGERSLFQEKMGILNILQAYTQQGDFLDHAHWWNNHTNAATTVGFCLHSDLIWGWLMILIGKLMHPRLKIELWGANNNNNVNLPTPDPHLINNVNASRDDMLCHLVKDNCTVTSPACHYQSKQSMRRLHAAAMQQQREKYT